jgi:hypothetical protein
MSIGAIKVGMKNFLLVLNKEVNSKTRLSVKIDDIAEKAHINNENLDSIIDILHNEGYIDLYMARTCSLTASGLKYLINL